MNTGYVIAKALNQESLSVSELTHLYRFVPLAELMSYANTVRNALTTPGIVSWIVDRNINITNRCCCCCKFCNFHEHPSSKSAYTTTLEQYREKIEHLFSLGGNQILLQGGLDPNKGIEYYTTLFSELKKMYPTLRLHALGPPEILFLAKKAKLSIAKTLELLVDSGLDSLPGAGAEILVDRVRKIISPNKCTSEQWLNVMEIAHQINLLTSATMMFGHVETIEERMEHLVKIRNLQSKCPNGAHGFKAFITWPFQKAGTRLEREHPEIVKSSVIDYIKMIAISRLAIVNIPNIQASWLTVGKETAQVCLHAGANDLGSIMIEENVVSSAGTRFTMTSEQMINTIVESGFTPLKRNQDYTPFVEEQPG